MKNVMEECTCDTNDTHSPVSIENLVEQPEEECHVFEEDRGSDEAVYHRWVGVEEEEIVSTSNDMMGKNHTDGQCPLSTSPSSSSGEQRVGGGEKMNRKKDGSFVPRTMFSFDPEPPSPPKNQTKNKKKKKKIKILMQSKEEVEPQAPVSIFSQTTMKYLKSSGLHSKRIENLLMKYLGPTTLSSQQDSV